MKTLQDSSKGSKKQAKKNHPKSLPLVKTFLEFLKVSIFRKVKQYQYEDQSTLFNRTFLARQELFNNSRVQTNRNSCDIINTN